MYSGDSAMVAASTLNVWAALGKGALERAAYSGITGPCVAKIEVRTVDVAIGEIGVAN